MKLRLSCLLTFVMLWLVPFYLTGAMLPSPSAIYSRLRFQYSAAGLFTRRITNWNQTLFQVRTQAVSEWKTLETAELSPMGAFGFRQRMDRVFQDTSNKKGVEQVRQRLAEWIGEEYAKKHPNEGEVTGVRMGQTFWASNRPELAQPKGEWVREPEDMEPSTPFKAYASFTITKGKAEVERVVSRATVPAPVKTPKVFERKKAEIQPKPTTPQR